MRQTTKLKRVQTQIVRELRVEEGSWEVEEWRSVRLSEWRIRKCCDPL